MCTGGQSASTDKPDSASCEITLGVLTAVEENSGLSQRALANKLGIALGLVNTYIKRCVRKGHIKIKHIPPNRYAYYLTPKGFSEKSRLTVEYLSLSLRFFREARAQCAHAFVQCEQQGWRRVALVGAGDLTDIAELCARDLPIEIVARLGPDETIDPESVDAVLVTDVNAPQATYERVTDQLPPKRVLFPPLLNISVSRAASRRRVPKRARP